MKNLLLAIISIGSGVASAFYTPVDQMKQMEGVWSGNCLQSDTQKAKKVKATFEIRQSTMDRERFTVYPRIEDDNRKTDTKIEWSEFGRTWSGKTENFFATVNATFNSVDIDLGFRRIRFMQDPAGAKVTGHLAVLDDMGKPTQRATFCKLERL